MAWAQFDALRENIPLRIKQSHVDEFHSIVGALEQSSGEDLSAFRIPGDQVKRRVIGGTFATRRSPGRTYLSNEEYCDDNFFVRQVGGLATYLRPLEMQREGGGHANHANDYWSMTDSELERLAISFNIPSRSGAGARGEASKVDRDRIIDALSKRDNASPAGRPRDSGPSVINVGNMYGSTIQQGTKHTSATIDYKAEELNLRSLLGQIRDSMNTLELGPAARNQLEVDAQTVEAQLLSPHPKSAVLRESLQSMLNIFEGVVANAISSGLLLELGKYLGR